MRLPVKLSDKSIRDFCKRWKVTELALFGSVLREDFSTDSDVDILATFSDNAQWSIVDQARMEMELSELTGRQVDLVDRVAVERSDNYIRRRHILSTSESIYVAR